MKEMHGPGLSRGKRCWCGVVVLLVVLGLVTSLRVGAAPAEEGGEPHVIKFACVAPEGSVYVSEARKWDQELRSLTSGRAMFRIFPGGILGEEEDIIRKMRAGQVHATGVTGIGMGEMAPEARVVELPRLFRNYEELDAVIERLTPYFAQKFSERGYVLMGFTEVGPIHIFSQEPIRNLSDLGRSRMWGWESDPLSLAIFDVSGASAVPLNLLSVLSSLQTGVIDGVYGSPLAVVTMQWFRYVKYMTSVPLGYASGVIVIDKRAFDALPEDIQALQMELGRKYTRRITERVRRDNARALELMKARGLRIAEPSEEDLKKLDEVMPRVWDRFSGTLYPPELLDQVRQIVAELRDHGTT